MIKCRWLLESNHLLINAIDFAFFKLNDRYQNISNKFVNLRLQEKIRNINIPKKLLIKSDNI